MKYRITFLHEPDRQPLVLEADKVNEKDGRFTFTRSSAEPDSDGILVGSIVNVNIAEVTAEEEAAAAATPKDSITQEQADADTAETGE